MGMSINAKISCVILSLRFTSRFFLAEKTHNKDPDGNFPMLDSSMRIHQIRQEDFSSHPTCDLCPSHCNSSTPYYAFRKGMLRHSSMRCLSAPSFQVVKRGAPTQFELVSTHQNLTRGCPCPFFAKDHALYGLLSRSIA